MQFRFGAGRAAIGCGSVLALFGLVLSTPVGVFLVKALGWITIVLGVIIVISDVYYWLFGPRRRYF